MICYHLENSDGGIGTIDGEAFKARTCARSGRIGLELALVGYNWWRKDIIGQK